jgi:hypothetical protein
MAWTKLISPSNARQFALEYAKSARAHPFRRVSKKFLEAVEVNARLFIQDRIRRHPSRGKTLV